MNEWNKRQPEEMQAKRQRGLVLFFHLRVGSCLQQVKSGDAVVAVNGKRGSLVPRCITINIFGQAEFHATVKPLRSASKI